MATANNPMTNVVFDDVLVNYCPPSQPYDLLDSHQGGKLRAGQFLPALPSITESFPLLPLEQQGNDPYIQQFILLVSMLLLFLGVLPCVLCCWKGCCTASFGGPHAPAKVGTCSALAFGAMLPFLCHYFGIEADLTTPAEYYRCEGLGTKAEGNVVTGATWPVPPCMEDQTSLPTDVAVLQCAPTGHVSREATIALLLFGFLGTVTLMISLAIFVRRNGKCKAADKGHTRILDARTCEDPKKQQQQQQQQQQAGDSGLVKGIVGYSGSHMASTTELVSVHEEMR